MGLVRHRFFWQMKPRGHSRGVLGVLEERPTRLDEGFEIRPLTPTMGRRRIVQAASAPASEDVPFRG